MNNAWHALSTEQLAAIIISSSSSKKRCGTYLALKIAIRVDHHILSSLHLKLGPQESQRGEMVLAKEDHFAVPAASE